MASAMIWTKDQKHLLHSLLTIVNEIEKVMYAWAPKGFDPPKFMDQLAQLGSDECFFSVSLSRANIFFKARYKGFENGGLKFVMPVQLYKVQRRKDMRFNIP